MKRTTFSRLGLFLLLVLLPASSFAWSDTVYRLVLRKAIDTLPKAQKKYFEAHRYEMPSLIPDEDPPVRPEGRRFALDLLGVFPFGDIPQDEATVLVQLHHLFGKNPTLRRPGRQFIRAPLNYSKTVRYLKYRKKVRA